MKRPFSSPSLRPWLVVAALTATSFGLAAASASATSEIEGVWSFNGGQVAIHPVAGGKFAGTVVTPTKFAECVHQTGEEMWTGISPQTDGSFWGFHQWLFEKTCEPNPTPGPTAWRVVPKAGGSRGLLVCFSEPGGPQPTIAPSGAAAHVTRSCQESAPTAALPVVVSGTGKGSSTQGPEVISFRGTILLPGAHACVKQGALRIRVRDPKYDPLKELVVRIKKHRLVDVRGVQKVKRGVVLRRLPSGTYTLRITATTVLNQKLTGKRTYRSCKRHASKVRLHHGHH
jgi:hypothetical protein